MHIQWSNHLEVLNTFNTSQHRRVPGAQATLTVCVCVCFCWRVSVCVCVCVGVRVQSRATV